MAYSKYKGVTFDKRRSKWVANIKINQKNKFLGYYDNELDAYNARKAGEVKYKDTFMKYSRDKAELHNKIIHDYKCGMSQEQLGEKYNLNPSTISEMFKLKGVESRSNKIELDDNEIKRLYLEDTVSAEKIADIMDVSGKTILDRLYKMNIDIRQRKYEFHDEHFLKVIDEPWKAYFVGLLWADGNMRDNKLHGSYNICVSLIEMDAYVLDELFKRIFNCTVNLYKEASKEFYDKDRNKWYRSKSTLKLSICSKTIHNDLVKIGCHPRKSLTIEYPDPFPDDMFWHFLRGYFDGDGCISGSFRLLGSQKFCMQIQEKFNKFGLTSYVSNRGKIYELRVNKKAYKQFIFKKMYEDADIYLKRKYDKFKAI